MTQTPPAGWYDDPHGQPVLRFWDGEQFTPATAAKDAGRPASSATPQVPLAPQVQEPSKDAADEGGLSTRQWVLAALGTLFLVGTLWGQLGGGSDEQRPDKGSIGYELGRSFGADDVTTESGCLSPFTVAGAQDAVDPDMTAEEADAFQRDFQAGCEQGFSSR